jgi:iron complex outermembrane recepter protein
MTFRPIRSTLLLAALPCAAPALADHTQQPTPHMLERVIVTGGRPATLPLEIPTTTEGVTGQQVRDTINATDAEDALKYLPSLLVRKRYIGDYDHAVLATRASGTGNSARSLVYADGILLSNLLGNGAFYTPRWGLVTPEEIERVDVLYGPFSAAYPGNSAGAVVDYVTRMPTRLEAHVKLQGFTQHYEKYGHGGDYGGGALSASLGSREGAWSWWVNASRMQSRSQPLSFVTRNSPPVAGVAGAVPGFSPQGQAWWILGDTGQTRTVQDHAKFKLAHDITSWLTASYTLAHWHGDNRRVANNYQRDAATGVEADPTNPAFMPSGSSLEHVAHGLSLKSHTRGVFDWEFAASQYRYFKDRVASATTSVPSGGTNTPGTTTQDGSGWHTLAAKGIWRPEAAHTVEFGAQQDAFVLRTAIDRSGEATSYQGRSTLRSLWGQDAWRFAPQWRAVLGLRAEQWRTFDGAYRTAAPVSDPANVTQGPFAERSEAWWSPKAAVAWQLADDWTLKASLGRAVRPPTLTELYQVRFNNAVLRPERSWTGEWTAEHALDEGLLRATFFAEYTKDALYSLPVTSTASSIRNIDAIRTRGLELAGQADHVIWRELDLSASLTFADSVIVRNEAQPASVGRWQPRVPRWRANLLATWRVDDTWRLSLGSRYSGRQYGQPINNDTNEYAYMGFSRFWVTDVRATARIDKHWTAALGIDNVNNASYWAFHPYPQRTFLAELRYDL